MRSKRYKSLKKQVQKQEPKPIKEVMSQVKELANAKFEESLEVAVRLGMKKQKEQFVIRGNVELPHFKGKEKRVVAIVPDEESKLITEIKKAGAVEAGGEKVIEKISKEGKVEADVVVAEPSMMPKLAKVAKVLGPKGLMPSPKNGTISKDLAKLVEKLKSGSQIEIRNDKSGNIHAILGKVSQKEDELEKNYSTLIDFIQKQKPENWKGTYIVGVTISSTMGPGIKVVT